MKYIILFFMIFVLLSCGTEDGDGFLTNYNVCVWEEGVDSYYYESTSSIAGTQALYETSSDKYLAQSFTLSEKKQFWGIELYLSKTATEPTSGFYVQIVGDSSGKPNLDDDKGESFTTSYSDINTSGSWVRVQFKNIPHLELNTTYWIVLVPYYSQNATRHVRWSYGAGSGMYESSSGSSWSAINQEAAFRLLACR